MKKIRKTYRTPKIKVGEIEIEAILQGVSNLEENINEEGDWGDGDGDI